MINCDKERDECNTKDFQKIPKNFIKPLKLEDILGNENETTPIYAYVLTTLKPDGNKFVQKGCSPNFEGELATLCDCKHRMRTSSGIKKGVWIAGFTSNKYNHMHNLYYLAKIDYTKDSFFDLQNCLSKSIVDAKDATIHRLGDIYIIKNRGDYHNPKNYYTPCLAHVHRKFDKSHKWEKDIYYAKLSKNKMTYSNLLVFEKDNTFVWEQPLYSITKNFRTKKFIPQEFIDKVSSLKQN